MSGKVTLLAVLACSWSPVYLLAQDHPPDFWASEYAVEKIGPYPVLPFPTDNERIPSNRPHHTCRTRPVPVRRIRRPPPGFEVFTSISTTTHSPDEPQVIMNDRPRVYLGG